MKQTNIIPYIGDNVTKPDIRFEKWKDPYGDNVEDIEWPGHDKTKIADDSDTYKDSYNVMEDEMERREIISPNKGPRFFATTFGPVPVTEYTNPSRIFNFWVGNTNFDLNRGIIEVIEKVPGVEILNIFTRYRFRIGVGKMFKDGDVMRDIKGTVLKHIKDNKCKPKTLGL